MNPDRPYPEEPVADFPEPPLSFTDASDREIDVAAYGDGPVAEEFEALVSMYANFDPADRAQGVPPTREEAIRNWLDLLLDGEAVNVIAWHGEFVAGHATLVPDEGEYELAIFVHQRYQSAGIGSRLIRCLLGEGRARGVEYVWLTVERWNDAAMALYRDVGFETSNAENFELEMSLRLA